MSFLQSLNVLKRSFNFKILRFLGLIICVLSFYLFFNYSYAFRAPDSIQEEDDGRDSYSAKQVFEVRQKLREYFTQSGMFATPFDPQSKSSLAVQKNCPNVFPSFSSAMQDFFVGEGEVGEQFSNEAARKQQQIEEQKAIPTIEEALENCAKQLRISYVDIYEKLEASKLFMARKAAFQGAEEPPGELWSEDLKSVRDISVDFDKFKACAQVIKRDLSDSQTLIDNMGETLENLYSMECHELDQFKDFVKSSVFRYLSQEGELVSLCGAHNPEGRVRDLFIQVAAPLDETSKRKSLFALCYEEEMEAINCCSLEGKCKGDEFSLASSDKPEDMCSSGHQATVESLAKNIQEQCPEFVKVCEDNCLSELQSFKQSMLRVFVVPYLRGLERTLGDDPCMDEIRSIRKAYKDNSRKKENGEGYTLTVNSDAEDIVNCETALEEMKNSEKIRQDLANRMEELCRNKDKNQANKGNKVHPKNFVPNVHQSTRTTDTSGDGTRRTPSNRGPASLDDVKFTENGDDDKLSEYDFMAGGDSQDTDGKNNLTNPYGGGAENPDGDELAQDDRESQVDWSREPCCGVCDTKDPPCDWDAFFEKQKEALLGVDEDNPEYYANLAAMDHALGGGVGGNSSSAKEGKVSSKVGKKSGFKVPYESS